VVIDGAKAGPAGGLRYVASDECWLGKIDRKDPNKIEWSKLPAHPGNARFAIAGGGSGRDHRVFFTGGTATPHDFRGIAYDGKAAEAPMSASPTTSTATSGRPPVRTPTIPAPTAAES